MTLDSVKSDHWEQGTLESLLFGVMVRTVQLLVTIHQEVAGYLRIGNAQVDGHCEGLGIPVGCTTVLLASEAFRADVQT